MTIDGRLAIGSLFVQGIGLANGFKQLADARTAKELRDAWYGIYDSAAGAIGGLLEMWAVAVNTRTVAKLGEAAAAKSLGLGALRFAGSIAGAAGGVVNAVGAFAKGMDAQASGEIAVRNLYFGSMAAFGGTTVTATFTGVGAVAETIAARKVGGAVVQQAARAIIVRVGAQGTLTVVGGVTITASGIGLVLLGLGIVFQVGAIVLTQTPMQKWVGRSYFGTGNDKFAKGDWPAEQAALNAAINSGSEEAPKDAGTSNNDAGALLSEVLRAMKQPRMARHGERVKPHYAPQPGQTQGHAGTSTDETRPDGKVSGIVKRYGKGERANNVAVALGLIKRSYADAIEYTGSPQSLRGIIMLWGLFGASISFGFGFWRLGREIAELDVDGFSFFIFLPPLFIAFGAYILLRAIRLELFRPKDEPTLFDRKNRKVYRVFRETQPGIKGLFKPWPLRAAEYDWNLIDAEHHAKLVTTGSTVTRYHSLLFLVRNSEQDPTIIDSFTIGNAMELGEQSVSAVWEHIRRFMEEGGPHLPPGETLAPAEPPQTLWQSLGAVGPIGPSYAKWWKNQAAFMILIHVVFPFFVPLFLLWGFFNWLSYKTATRIQWPEDVARAVGPALPPPG